MQEGSRGNTSLVIYIHPSSPHQLVKCPQCGLATKNAWCSDIFAAWPWFLLPWGHLWFFLPVTPLPLLLENSQPPEVENINCAPKKDCPNCVSSTHYLSSCQSLQNEGQGNLCQKRMWGHKFKIAAEKIIKVGWSVSTGRKGWGWAGIDNSDLITTILILVFMISWSSHEKSIIIAVPEWPRIWRGGISLTAWALNDAGPRKVDSPICPSCFPMQPDQSVTSS